MLSKIAAISAVPAVVAVASCSGSADPSASTCYEGAAGALGLKETVKVNLKAYASGKGTMDLTGTGIQGFTCADHSFTKSGQAITTDLSDCLPSGVTVPSVKYCSDSDEITVTVKDKVVPLPITATLKKVSCAASNEIDFATCSGSADPTGTGCYEGKAGALGLTEDVKVNVKAFASGKGTMDLSGSGIEKFTCADHAFTKSGQEISVDVSDCVPSAITVSDVKYCSDSDQIKVTVKDKAVPLPISALLSKVTCDANIESGATCSGTDDPSASTCYEGAAGALGLKETVKVNLKAYASGKGTMDLSGTGIQGFTCADHAFTKSGQAITTDLSDCLPSGVTVPSVKYCSASDTIAVTVKDKAVPLPITATLKKVSCAASNDIDFATCTGTADPAGAGCYEGKAGALGLTEDVKVNVKAFASGKGTMDLSGSGIEEFTCADHSFTKSGQEISVDVSDCVPSAITVSDVKYCSDSDQIKVTVKDKAVPLPISALLSKVTCGANVESGATCSGTADPAASTCYEGAAGALGLKETVKVNLKAYASGKGTMDLTGTGIQGFTCGDHAFTKSGQAITTDLSDCLPSGVTVPSVKYCSDSDEITVTVKDKVVPLPITATLKKVSCAASNEIDFATCTGTADLAGGVCYEGKAGALGLTEDVKVNVKAFAGGKGTMDLSGSGIEKFTCSDHSFTKSGQEISVDVTDCAPSAITVSDVKYCSDSDQIKVTVKDKAVPLPISALLSKVACATDDTATIVV